MKIQILSDVHLEFHELTLPATDADVIVLAGDIDIKRGGVLWALEQLPDRPVIYVPGNHEFYGGAAPRMIGKMRAVASGTNVHVLSDEAVTIDGVTFLGSTLWTDFAVMDGRMASRTAMAYCGAEMNDYHRIRLSPVYRKLRPADTLRWHERSVRWLRDRLAEEGQHVVVTHHAPSMEAIPVHLRDDPVCAAFASDLDDLVISSGARLWIHGHLHMASCYKLGDTELICNPRGYPTESGVGFDPGLVVDVYED